MGFAVDPTGFGCAPAPLGIPVSDTVLVLQCVPAGGLGDQVPGKVVGRVMVFMVDEVAVRDVPVVSLPDRPVV
jgi:hypothetical protein